MTAPRMTIRVRNGLAILAEFGRAYMEADLQEDDEGAQFYPSLGEQGSREHSASLRDVEAAMRWIDSGGLRIGGQP